MVSTTSSIRQNHTTSWRFDKVDVITWLQAVKSTHTSAVSPCKVTPQTNSVHSESSGDTTTQWQESSESKTHKSPVFTSHNIPSCVKQIIKIYILIFQRFWSGNSYSFWETRHICLGSKGLLTSQYVPVILLLPVFTLLRFLSQPSPRNIAQCPPEICLWFQAPSSTQRPVRVQSQLRTARRPHAVQMSAAKSGTVW